MNTKSILFRLTLWYTASFILAIAIIFISFFILTKQTLFSQVDRTLIEHSNKIIEIVTQTNGTMHEAFAAQSFLQEFSQLPGMLVVITNSAGKTVTSSQATNPPDTRFSQLFETAKNTDRPFFTDQTVGTQLMRFYVSPVHQNNIFVGVVFMGHPIDAIQQSINILLTILGGVFIIFLIPTIIGGYLNARGAIQPVATITGELEHINPDNLHERVTNPHTGDEIEKLAVTFNTLLDRLHDAFTRERQFIGDVAHELKTPLSILQTGSEVILAKERTKEEYKKALSETLIDTKRVTNTVKNILDLAWSEADSATQQFETFDISELLRELKEIAVKLATEKKIRIETAIQPDVKAYGKKDKLSRAVINIIDNAIRYTPSGGTVRIRLTTTDEHILIQIRDIGVGIHKKDVPHIFERYYRGSKTDKTFGSGLGLSIALAIINAHHGAIHVKSQVSKGSEFTIYLPLSSS